MQGMINYTNTLFNILVIDFVKLCKSSNTILVREDDKPWYDSEILRKSRKRGRLKRKTEETGNITDWANFKCFRFTLFN